VTLVPELAKRASHVTMLQRSPTYIVAAPSEDRIARFFARHLPPALAHALTRWKNVLFGMLFFNFATRFPERARRLLLRWVYAQLGGNRALMPHFTPSYNPWEQRLCLVPDADLFGAVHSGAAEVVTDRIARFTERGILLESGKELEADVIVTATGLRLKVFGGLELTVDGQRVEMSRTMLYKGMMLSGVPNLAFAFGYTNASWTLKCELTSQFVCRILNHMDAVGCTESRANRPDASVAEEPLLSFSSGYVQRGVNDFPRQGSVAPYRLYQNYALDLLSLRHAPLEDGVLQFSRGVLIRPDARILAATRPT
jgi:cation diffusion facilitator CzcD-associated flavoprotein CzcO